MCERFLEKKKQKVRFLKLPSSKKTEFALFCVCDKKSLSLLPPHIFLVCKTTYYSNQDSLDLDIYTSRSRAPPHYPNNSISLVVVCKLKLDKRHTFLLQLAPAINVSCLFTLRCSAALKEKTTKLIKITI